MRSFIEIVDIHIAEWIHLRFQNESFRSFFSTVNRGEVYAFLVIPAIFFSNSKQAWLALAYTGLVTFCTDRLVLFIKQKVFRMRPSLKVLGKPNTHPDLNHSFPSAHAANSMVVATILCFQFQVTPLLFLLSFLAGLGRLLSLHHFLSDVLGGWMIGFGIGMIGIFIYNLFLQVFI